MIDVRVIGGGPAGCASAIRLAQQGLSVRLYEKAHFPRPKLCGGYLSAEALPEFKELGLWDDLLAVGARAVHRVLVSSPSGAQAVSALSAPAYSLSRYRLDELLLRRTQASGVEVLEGIEGIAATQPQEAAFTIMATGRSYRHTTGDATVDPSVPTFYGFQAFFSNVDGMTDQIELDMIPGGYVGLVKQEDGVNVCGLVDKKTMRRAGPALDRAMQQFAAANPLLKKRMQSADRVSDWHTIGPVRIGQRRLVDENMFFVGDAACVVDPFAGEGVAMGLATGRVLQRAFLAPVNKRAEVYTRLWHERFDSAIRLQRFICWAVPSPWWQETLTHLCMAFPSVMRRLTDGSRPTALAVEAA